MLLETDRHITSQEPFLNRLGKTLIIANPAAKSGQAKDAAQVFYGLMRDAVGEDRVELLETTHASHAEDLAKEHARYADTLISVGGDGLVHEIVNGLMQVSESERPALGVVPVGSGNDYALSLGMSHDLKKAFDQIVKRDVRHVDVGKVNERYFAETLSFGLDAAIALDTMERRRKTGRSGTILYAESGFDQLFHHLDPYAFTATLHGVPGHDVPVVLDGQSYIFAVQIGWSYGGHFKVCPKANMHDGLFDICIARAPLSSWKALLIFLMAKGGHHGGFKAIEFHRARSLELDFKTAPPGQTDGELMRGIHFDIESIDKALSVIVGGSTCA